MEAEIAADMNEACRSLLEYHNDCVWCNVVADDGTSSGLIDTKALLSLLQKPDQQTPSLPSIYLDSRLAPETGASAPPATQGMSFMFLLTCVLNRVDVVLGKSLKILQSHCKNSWPLKVLEGREGSWMYLKSTRVLAFSRWKVHSLEAIFNVVYCTYC